LEAVSLFQGEDQVSNNLYLDGQVVKAEVAKLLATLPELAEDEALKLSMIEGETDALKVISKALEQRQEAEMMIGGVKARIIELTARQGRYERLSASMKLLIRNIMRAAGLNTLALPEASLSLTKARESVSILNIDELPQGTFKLVRVPDKKAIGELLAAGEQIPGAGLVLGETGLTIRVK
jgi:hypothetical protein